MVASAKSFGLFSSKMDNFTTVNWEGSGRNTFFFFARASYCGAVLGCSVTLNTNAASINRVWLFFWGPIF